jgi:hypothetical protein
MSRFLGGDCCKISLVHPDACLGILHLPCMPVIGGKTFSTMLHTYTPYADSYISIMAKPH